MLSRRHFALSALFLTQTRGWMSSGGTNEQLVTNLIRDGVIETDAVASVMRRLDRRIFAKSLFAPEQFRSKADAYRDAPLPISEGATISAPHMHARALEILLPALVGKSDAKALDVGSGTGYLTVALALLGDTAYGIEHTQDLTDLAKYNVQELDPELRSDLRLGTDDSRVHFLKADGWDGIPAAAPFDAIHVGAAARTVPDALVNQLARGGRLVIPVGEPNAPQFLVQVDKRQDDSLQVSRLFGVRYVELVDHQPPKDHLFHWPIKSSSSRYSKRD